MKKFYAVIGNPPYQEDVEGNGRTNPIYPMFMDESYSTSRIVELITPARFLFDAGQTAKAWNRKMLDDRHLRVLRYEADGSVVFPNTDIKGGVAITIRDENSTGNPIGLFIPEAILRSINEKVLAQHEASIIEIITGAVPYSFTEAVRDDLPTIAAKLPRSFDLRSNILNDFEGTLFTEEKPIDSEKYGQIFGNVNGKRVFRWINERYIKCPKNYRGYKVALPESNNSGAFGETFANPMILNPGCGHTQTFITLGSFKQSSEASALLAYLKTKFLRTLLGILKKTQHNPISVWKYIPLQDFTPNSDIDWTKSIPEIDQQLYVKYGLDAEEITFIESHVKEMS